MAKSDDTGAKKRKWPWETSPSSSKKKKGGKKKDSGAGAASAQGSGRYYEYAPQPYQGQQYYYGGKNAPAILPPVALLCPEESSMEQLLRDSLINGTVLISILLHDPGADCGNVLLELRTLYDAKRRELGETGFQVWRQGVLSQAAQARERNAERAKALERNVIDKIDKNLLKERNISASELILFMLTKFKMGSDLAYNWTELRGANQDYERRMEELRKENKELEDQQRPLELKLSKERKKAVVLGERLGEEVERRKNVTGAGFRRQLKKVQIYGATLPLLVVNAFGGPRAVIKFKRVILGARRRYRGLMDRLFSSRSLRKVVSDQTRSRLSAKSARLEKKIDRLDLELKIIQEVAKIFRDPVLRTKVRDASRLKECLAATRAYCSKNIVREMKDKVAMLGRDSKRRDKIRNEINELENTMEHVKEMSVLRENDESIKVIIGQLQDRIDDLGRLLTQEDAVLETIVNYRAQELAAETLKKAEQATPKQQQKVVEAVSDTLDEQQAKEKREEKTSTEKQRSSKLDKPQAEVHGVFPPALPPRSPKG